MSDTRAQAAAAAFELSRSLYELMVAGFSKEAALRHLAENEKRMTAGFDAQAARIDAAARRTSTRKR
jgi:hypothetical protein